MQSEPKTSEKRKQDWVNILIRYRWLIAIIYVIFAFLLEVADHSRQGLTTLLHPIFLIKFFFLGLVVPTVFLITCSFLHKKLSILDHLDNKLQTESELLNLLSTQLGEKEFCNQVVAFFEIHFPPVKTHISLKSSPNKASIENKDDNCQDPFIESVCTSMGNACTDFTDEMLPNAILESGGQGNPVVHRYCLALLSENQSVGVIALDLPPDQSFSPEQIRLMKRLAVLLVQKIIQIQLNCQLQSLTLRYEVDLRHISQNLHDTLGQSVGFIRLKMEEIQHDFSARRYADLAEELDRVQAVTEEAYQQVRGILAELHPNSAIDLTTALSTQATLNAQRAGFEFLLKEIGEPRPLPPLVKQQLIYIFREALNNVERHAHSGRVELSIEWDGDSCKVSLKDDGIGFTPTDLPIPDHYGLFIMRERAQDISARFTLESSPGNGTQITLIVPLTQKIN